jgi:peptidoglycan/xylan/chitin deacetylase (PgdA/CDA1 family)
MQLLAVNYHYFREEKYENGIYPLTKREFLNQIDELSKYYEFISQNDFIDKIKNKKYSHKKYCLLTFDDGLKEQMNALYLLNKKGIPGVFYISTNPIKNNKVLNVHKLHYIRSVMKYEDIFKFIDSKIDLDIIKYPKNIQELYRYDNLETKKLKYLLNFILDNKTKDELINELFKQIADEKEFSQKLYMKKLYMNIDDIKKLNSQGYLGTHTDLHLPLATLSKEDIKNDINNSLEFFYKDCAISNIDSISYPFGGIKAVSEKVIDVSKEIGFSFGLTMLRGINNLEDLKNPLMLKRIDTNDAPGGKLKSEEFCL